MRFKYTIYEGTQLRKDIVEQDVIEVVTERDAKDYADECLRQYHESFEDKTYFAEIERVSFCCACGKTSKKVIYDDGGWQPYCGQCGYKMTGVKEIEK